MLIILGNGKSLPIFIVFMGKSNGSKVQKLRKYSKAVSGYIYVSCKRIVG